MKGYIKNFIENIFILYFFFFDMLNFCMVMNKVYCVNKVYYVYLKILIINYLDGIKIVDLEF